ncbi:MAG: hypothetical protein ABW007_18640 [Chitinophagaceae bacterium]
MAQSYERNARRRSMEELQTAAGFGISRPLPAAFFPDHLAEKFLFLKRSSYLRRS